MRFPFARHDRSSPKDVLVLVENVAVWELVLILPLGQFEDPVSLVVPLLGVIIGLIGLVVAAMCVPSVVAAKSWECTVHVDIVQGGSCDHKSSVVSISR